LAAEKSSPAASDTFGAGTRERLIESRPASRHVIDMAADESGSRRRSRLAPILGTGVAGATPREWV
jgi:hypothetical protein